jgi:hypothetical protein
MRPRLFEHACPPWITRLLHHPVVPVALVVALSALALWALLATEARLIHSPNAPLVFSPK